MVEVVEVLVKSKVKEESNALNIEMGRIDFPDMTSSKAAHEKPCYLISNLKFPKNENLAV